jgi:hypothetical protein
MVQLEKSSSRPHAASVFVSPSVICHLYTNSFVELSHQLFILFLREKNTEKNVKKTEKDTNKDL